MQWIGLNELRERFLGYFEQRGHHRFNSFSLVPAQDKSLLLINSGMAPLKKYFLGQERVPGDVATSCQKCIRTPDIERVGITSRHGTFFEMLGNFSFASYFKREAMGYALEFLTKELEIPLDLLYFSVYLEDDEAYEIWTTELNIPESHMVRFGKEDNFWEIGAGPCGPCSEIYFDRGETYGCGSPDCKVGCECDRYIEIWNLVFTQYISDGKGNYEKMEHGNIDTGMGLERLACVIQGVDNLFEVDTVRAIITKIEQLSNYKYKNDTQKDISVRVITDHIRSTVFLVGDGVLPGNEGRGYVLRRLLRRAARHGRLLGIKGAFLQQLCELVISLNAESYPELNENAQYIKKVISVEEERFAKTIDSGSSLLFAEIEKVIKSGGNILGGDVAFKLSDTFGFPLDLTKEILSEQGLNVDEVEFKRFLQVQKDTARSARAKQGGVSWSDEIFSEKNLPSTEFCGYSELTAEVKMLAIAYEGQLTDMVSVDDEPKEDIGFILDKTTFYAEGGGEVGDTGILYGSGVEVEVTDTVKISGGLYLHKARLIEGRIFEGMALTASVNKRRREAIKRNHTAAHLLQKALIETLGDHVHQAGSFVDDTRVRFDFTHFSQMTADEIKKVEEDVNRAIFDNLDVKADLLPIEEAKTLGAQALFGEKYGDVVRVISVTGNSVEFCGGCHVNNTSQIGCFKILSEGSVAAGVRRIEGTTGIGVLTHLGEREELLGRCQGLTKLNSPIELPARISSLISENKEKEVTINSLKNAAAEMQLTAVVNSASHIKGITLFAGLLKDVDAGTLRECSAKLKNKSNDAVVLLIGQNDDKISIVAACSKGAVDNGFSAGTIIKSITAKYGGSGGGKPDFAMGGLKDPSCTQNVMDNISSFI